MHAAVDKYGFGERDGCAPQAFRTALTDASSPEWTLVLPRGVVSAIWNGAASGSPMKIPSSGIWTLRRDPH